MFEENGILSRLDLGDGRARYEEMPESHHDHLIDTRSGKIIEFNDPEIEAMQEKIAARIGYRLVAHRPELFGVPLDDKADGRKNPGQKDVGRSAEHGVGTECVGKCKYRG